MPTARCRRPIWGAGAMLRLDEIVAGYGRARVLHGVSLSLERNAFDMPADVNPRDTKQIQKDMRRRWRADGSSGSRRGTDWVRN